MMISTCKEKAVRESVPKRSCPQPIEKTNSGLSLKTSRPTRSSSKRLRKISTKERKE